MTLRCPLVPYLVLLAPLVLAGCGGGSSSPTDPGGNNGGGTIPPTTAQYVVFAWNDLGMHCLNPTFDAAVVLPPYNTIWAQVIRRGNPPTIVTEGLTAEYRIVDNTTSYGKTDSFGGSFAGFWDNCQKLFGITLAHDTGLNLETPDLHNGLSGSMVVRGNHFQVNGIPLTPVTDANVWNPFQVAEITIKSGSTIVAQTRATAPTSDEMHCNDCHAAGGPGSVHIPGGGGANAFDNVLLAHDALHGTTLDANKPVLCASCHGSPALGQTGPGSANMYLSQAMHGSHATRGAVCYQCHPGTTTRCSRSLAHTAADGNCVTCHGTMAEIASGIAGGTRIPWVNEPKCVTCHTGVAGVDTGADLYRNAAGHGNVACEACHFEPHAMYPSREAVDEYQPQHYQNAVYTIGSCHACHDNSRGEGASDFAEEHGGAGGRTSACNICHTQVSATTAQWPHAFQWRAH